MGNAMKNRAYLRRSPKPPGQDHRGTCDSVPVGSGNQLIFLPYSPPCDSLLLADGPSASL